MYKYKIILPYKITECTNCPFRHEEIIFENIQSLDKLNGVTMIQRRKCACAIMNKPLDFNIQVNGYQSLCPLNDSIEEVE